MSVPYARGTTAASLTREKERASEANVKDGAGIKIDGCAVVERQTAAGRRIHSIVTRRHNARGVLPI